MLKKIQASVVLLSLSFPVIAKGKVWVNIYNNTEDSITFNAGYVSVGWDTPASGVLVAPPYSYANDHWIPSDNHGSSKENN